MASPAQIAANQLNCRKTVTFASLSSSIEPIAPVLSGAGA